MKKRSGESRSCSKTRSGKRSPPKPISPESSMIPKPRAGRWSSGWFKTPSSKRSFPASKEKREMRDRNNRPIFRIVDPPESVLKSGHAQKAFHKPLRSDREPSEPPFIRTIGRDDRRTDDRQKHPRPEPGRSDQRKGGLPGPKRPERFEFLGGILGPPDGSDPPSSDRSQGEKSISEKSRHPSRADEAASSRLRKGPAGDRRPAPHLIVR